MQLYVQCIQGGLASFQKPNITLPEFAEKIDLTKCFVLEIENKIKGFAFFTPTSNRCVYSGLGEESIYISPDIAGKGYGTQLLNHIVNASEHDGFWSLHALIFAQNTPSIALHKKSGFKVVGIREKLGKMTYGPMKGQWIDIVFMERRSKQFCN